MKFKKTIIAVLILLVVFIGFCSFLKSGNNAAKYITETVGRGDVQAMVFATGTVNAVTTVLVGTQVSGTIKELFVDYNSPVKKGQLLATIDGDIRSAGPAGQGKPACSESQYGKSAGCRAQRKNKSGKK